MSSVTISKDKAIQIASNFMYGVEMPIKNTTIYGEFDDAQIHIINFAPEGWVLVSSNYETRPVIGYSPTGYFDAKDLKSNTANWLNNQINQIINRNPEKTWNDEWETLETGRLPVLKSSSSVAPLLSTKWNQGAKWNDLCPAYAEGPNGKAYVGCVAVAMAQALYNIKYPENPVDSKSYALAPYGTISTDFDSEPAYEWEKMSLTSADDYNRQLLYNCAVSVEMDFGGAGSGAYTTRVPFAFKRYFQMGEQVSCIKRENYETESEWTSVLKDELSKGNVIVYSGDPGTGQAGHAFNMDGYTASGYFHFNWGWSGSQNGYFSINDVAPGSNDFNANQKAVIGISKPYFGPTDIQLSNLTIKANQAKGAVVGNISIIDESENDEFSFEVKGAPLFLEDGYQDAKFYVEDMQLKANQSLSVSSYAEVATITVTDSEGLSFEKSFNITVTEGTSLSTINESLFQVSPNPATDYIYINNIELVDHVSIMNMAGQKVLSSSKIINVSELRRGIYILQINDKNGNTSLQKIVLQ